MIDFRPIWEWILDGGWFYLGLGWAVLVGIAIGLNND